MVALGKQAQAGDGGGAVALLVELMSSHLALPETATLCAYRFDYEARGAERVFRPVCLL